MTKTAALAILCGGLALLCYYSVLLSSLVLDNVQREMPNLYEATAKTTKTYMSPSGNSGSALLVQPKQHLQQLLFGASSLLVEDEDSPPLSLPTIDIMSVGSLTQQDIQKTQLETFGSHKAIRNFYAANEMDDTDVDCHLTLNLSHVVRISRYCRTRRRRRILANIAKHFFTSRELLQKKNAAGWMCAQKRPFDGFYNMIQKYNYRSVENLPDYLLVIDDDTWVNVDQMIQYIPQEYPANIAHVVAGCMMITNAAVMNFTVPYGGYGILFSRQALSHLIQPLHCGEFTRNASIAKLPVEADFETRACWRLGRNGIGERRFYEDGMSLAELMHIYAVDNPYSNIKNWTREGFCMHSDWLWAYMTNYYHLAAPPTQPRFKNPRVLHDRLIGYNRSQVRPWTSKSEEAKAERHLLGQCQHGNDLRNVGKSPSGNEFCGPEAHLCHRITPTYMRLLHTWNEKYFPRHYPTTLNGIVAV